MIPMIFMIRIIPIAFLLLLIVSFAEGAANKRKKRLKSSSDDDEVSQYTDNRPPSAYTWGSTRNEGPFAVPSDEQKKSLDESFQSSTDASYLASRIKRIRIGDVLGEYDAMIEESGFVASTGESYDDYEACMQLPLTKDPYEWPPI